MGRFDGRSVEGRRLRDLFRSYSAQLGNPDDAGAVAMIMSAAEQVIGAERVRSQYFAGKAVYDEVIRAEGAANRALKRLGLTRPAAQPRKSLAEKLMDVEAAQKTTAGAAEADASEGVDVAADQKERLSEARSQSA
jgi:hypothetical protein